MTIDIQIKQNIEINSLITITSPNKNTLKNAELILNNKFFLRSNLDVIDFTPNIDWNYTHNKAAKTYQLYLHALDMISVLCDAFTMNKDDSYLRKAIEIIYDWSDFKNTNNHGNTLIWSDHSSASRTITLTYLLVLLKSNDISFKYNIELLYKIMFENIHFLYIGEVYKRNNHGIMMDRALLQASIVFEFENALIYQEKAIYRIKDNFYNSFSHKSTHLENSPEYHLLVNRLFLTVQDFLKIHDLSLGEDIAEKLNQAEDYYKFITKPNLELPLLGDTKKINMKNIKKNYNSFLDSEAGIAILQAINKNKPINSTWISFIAGYSSLVHKHYDDLSFTLYNNGHDIFVDSGQYNYSNSKERFYVKSTKAHNTITINNSNYTLFEPNKVKNIINITDFNSNHIYDYVKGINFGYKDTEISRSIVFVKSGIIFLLDRISSNKTQMIRQHFNLAPHIKILEEDKNKTILDSKGTKISIEQFNPVDSLIVHKADLKKPYAIMSEKLNEIIKIQQIEYSKKAKNHYFLTVITFNQSNNVNNIQFNDIEGFLSFESEGIPYNFII